MDKAKNIDWFFYVLVIFMLSLPFSEALISISGVFLLLISLMFIRRPRAKLAPTKRKQLLLFLTIYLLYLIGMFFCKDIKWGIYDLQKNIPFLIIPLAFFVGKRISSDQLKKLLLVFSFSVVASAFITIIGFYLSDQSSVLDAQEQGFIHHIRFSFQVIFAIVILSNFFLLARVAMGRILKVGGIISILFLVLFLIWHQSFTGIVTFVLTAFLGIIIIVFNLREKVWKRLAWTTLILLFVIPVGYLYYAIEKFYDVDVVEFSQLEKVTSQGNNYSHNLQNKKIENGHYVGLYWCEEEMEKAWNKRANIKYIEIDKNGYQVKETLVRYLTSMNLRKDAEGISQLSVDDIRNIESGISNYILAQKGLSLYPRIYVSIWELDTYFKTGYANNQSLSQRMEYGKAAITIIKENFWFGVGTGNWKKAYYDAYVKNKSQMDAERYADAHNQYLNYWVKFGFLGLMWILFAIIYPVIKTKAYKNPVFLLFLVSMLIGNMGDSNFETHVGSSFFVLFYCLFISAEEMKLETSNA